MDVAVGETVLGAKLTRRRLHSVESLARENDLDARTLRNVLVARGLVPKTSSAESFHVFDADAGQRLAASIRRSIHVISLPKALNCTRPQADQLLQERLVAPLSDGLRNAPGRTQKAIDAGSVAAFLRKLEASADPVDAAPTGLVPIAKAAEKAKTSCVTIVHLVLGGHLPTVRRLTDIEGNAGILVDPTEVKQAMSTHMRGISSSDAFGCLRVPTLTGWALADRDEDPCLGPIVIEGPTGHRFFRFDPVDVEAFRGRFMTVPRIAETLELPCGDLVRRLKGAGFCTAVPWEEIGIDLYEVSDLSASVLSVERAGT